MDEYYCPNCGATLNDQVGFDPSCGTWTCTKCGMHLMDDDIFEGDTYEGIAWYCDECGALLNRQPGFSDSYGSWTCVECGHENRTTEDDIYDTEEDYESQRKEDNTLVCPNCGEILNDQFCFDEYSDDWTCTECGANLRHNFSDDPYVIVDEGQDDMDGEAEDDFSDDGSGKDEYDSDESSDHRDSSHVSSHNRSPVCTESHSQTKATKSFFRRHWKGTFLTILFLIAAAGASLAVWEFQKMIPMTYSSDELIGLNYEDVIAKLENAGFTHVWAEGTEDLAPSDAAKENTIYEIVVSGKTEFDSETRHPYDKEIIIKYHVLKRIPLPLSSKDVKGMNYLDVVSAFRDAGFANIRTTAEYDVIIGWLAKDGEVEKVTINNEGKFDTKMSVRPDAEIAVTYHTYRNNKT